MFRGKEDADPREARPMKHFKPTIFDRYIARQVFSSMLTGVIVLTGVMVLGNVFKEMERLLGDTSSLPFSAALKFIAFVIPYSLIFTIPWAMLTAILLVFGRMSADNEMTALRMTGRSMPRICAPVFVLAVLMSVVCYFVNVDLAPFCKNSIKRLFYDLTLERPEMLFQPGKIVDKFPGYQHLYRGARRQEAARRGDLRGRRRLQSPLHPRLARRGRDHARRRGFRAAPAQCAHRDAERD